MTVDTREVAWFARPCSGETLSGDAVVVVDRGDDAFLAVVDGLGHGRLAHEVARKAADTLRSRAGPDLVATMTALDRTLRGTLGVVAGACWYEGRTGDARWVGVGNVMLRTFGTVEASLPGQDGLLGHAFPTPREQRVRLAPGDLLLLVTDGVRERLAVADYPGLLGDGAPLVARRVVERFGRDHDDVTCVALRRGR